MNRLGVRILFAAAILLLPVELAVARFIDEPYPALFQPSFAGTPLVDGVLTKVEPEVTLTFTDGTTADISYDQVLPKSRLHTLVVFQAAFYDSKKATAPATIAWLRDSLAEQFPGRDVATMTVTWNQIKYNAQDPSQQQSTFIKTVVVDVNGGN